MAYVDFFLGNHLKTKRDYLERVCKEDKPACTEIAIRYGRDYWDGDRKYGYGGYKYDGRWRPIADKLAAHYKLEPGARILDVGCGKGFMLYELGQAVPGAELAGLDISAYAVENAKPEVKPFLKVGSCVKLPWPDKHFDFVLSAGLLHNLYNYELDQALREIERVGRGAKHVMFESYRDEREKNNLLNWQLTCRAFHTPKEWEWLMERSGYTGDYSYIVFQ